MLKSMGSQTVGHDLATEQQGQISGSESLSIPSFTDETDAHL